MIGDVVRKYRKLKGLTQPQLCEILNIHQTHISKIEQNKRCPSVELLAEIRRVLDIPLMELWRDENTEKVLSESLRAGSPSTAGEFCDPKTLEDTVADVMAQLDDIQKEKVLDYARGQLEVKRAKELIKIYRNS
ncbi:helix-turn-helix transcriptional regulator [Cloacibacillus sp.]|uniref:helix-turn-helix domain-containing protein n=1 Tax=Cloacibacillus sp. TaxID=2049023 RepID=UPI0025BFBB2F|nr:helix-turn-helix transcriptional regulator [Cloacibacillus sp.]MCC8058232.1 helix-turn-helix domain-containing protein [Cloacibacillus sp.]